MLPDFYEQLRQSQRQLSLQIARAAAAETRVGVLEADLAFSRDQGQKLVESDKILRQRIANLEAQVADLRRKTEELLQQRLQVQLEELAQGLNQTLEAGESVMPGRVISHVEATFRGLARASDAGLGLQMTGSESSPAGAFSEIHLTVSASPGSLAKNVMPVVARALERLQSVLSGWPKTQSTASAEKLVAELALLLGARSEWNAAMLAGSMEGLIPRLREMIEPLRHSPDWSRSSQALDLLSQKLAQRVRPSPSATNFAEVAAALDAFTANLERLGSTQ